MSGAPELNNPGNGTQIKTTGDVTISDTHIPETGKERTVIIVLFALLLVSMLINCMNYARNGRNDEKLLLAENRATKAETDLKTQEWLSSDSLTKENAEIRAHVTALEDLVQSYGIGKDIPHPPKLRRK